MKYNLEIFDKIIYDILNNTDLIFGEKEFNFNTNLLTNKNIRIKLSIKNIVFKQNSNSKIECFIHKQQLALENLITLSLQLKHKFKCNFEKIFSKPENLLKIQLFPKWKQLNF